MANPRIVYPNLLVSTDSTLGGSDADTNFPATNARDGLAGSPWRTNSGSLASQELRIDLQSAQYADLAALIGTNLTSLATVRVQASTLADYSVLALNETVSMDGRDNGLNVFRFLASPGTFRFWRFTFDDSLNAADYLEVGEAWLGDYVELSFSYNHGYTELRKSLTRHHETPYGQQWTFKRPSRREFEVDWSNTSQNLRDQLWDLFDEVDSADPFLFVPNPDEDRIFFVRREADLADSPVHFQVHNIGRERWIEEPSGLGIGA